MAQSGQLTTHQSRILLSRISKRAFKKLALIQLDHQLKKFLLKPILIKLLFSLLPVIVINQDIIAQTNNSGAPSPNSQEKKIYLPGNLQESSGDGTVFLNDINIKAVREFSKSFRQVQDVKWQIIIEGFVAIFTKDSVRTHVFYNKKGIYMSMVRYYSENRLPPQIRHLTKSNYYDYSIYYITEVEYNSTIVYFIKLEDKICWKTISIKDGEIQVLDIIKKAG